LKEGSQLQQLEILHQPFFVLISWVGREVTLTFPFFVGVGLELH